MDLNREQLSVPIPDDLEIWEKSRLNRVADQLRGALPQVQGLLDSAYIPCPVSDTDQNGTSGRIGEGRDRAQEALRR